MTTKIKYLLISLVFTQTTVAAVQFDEQWKVSAHGENKYLLEHKSEKTVVLVSKYKTESPVVEFDQYFAAEFSEDALKSRRVLLDAESEDTSGIKTGSDAFKGVRYGATSAVLAHGSFLHERIWAQKKSVWHLALITDQKSLDAKVSLQMNSIMSSLDETVKASFFKSLLPLAHADDATCAPLKPQSINQLSKIISKVEKMKDNKRCDELSIHPTNKSNEFGLKIHKATTLNCFEGRAEALEVIRASFMKSLDELEADTSKNIARLECKAPIEKEGFFNAISYQFAMERYSKCLQSAGTMAGSKMMVQTVVQTAEGVRALYNWVKNEKNPLAVVSSILAKEDASFMCLTPEAQMRSVCAFVTHVATFSVKAIAGAGAAKIIASGVRAASTIATVHKASVVANTHQITGDAVALKMAVKGSLDQTFKEAHPFVRRVAAGQAEAKKVIEALRQGAILEKSMDEIDSELLKKGFVKINTCIKLQGKCVKHKNPRTGVEEDAPMVVYVHPSGVAARIKPDGQTNAKFRPQPHGSFMLVDPNASKLAEGINQLKKNPELSEKFMNEHLSWDQELAKIDMATGKPLPSAPVRTRVPAALNPEETTRYHDVISNLTHFPLRQ